MKEKVINIGEAKKHFSALLGEVAYGRKHIVITKRGRPMARLIPAVENDRHLINAKGWLENDDPFFKVMNRVVGNRSSHGASILKGAGEE
ncbi:MAG: type II toxin-antitoxin system prevent-host-death family antitoxin [Thermoplasmata archaeon]|nr:MAG: type II toxin-antitoxin system prevent-host-death family antitoxin [Deltaproteobacteria bacterium]RLF60291.1 MAG: type II toxin-antitoxin system prevent-host-death family antitoxin [Thermoplasmata archaeon]